MSDHQHTSRSAVRGRISVIIPSYNYGRFLKEALDSVLVQEVPDCEIIIVDDGSVDDTEKVAHCYREQTTYIFQENAGLSAARNTGIDHSTGQFLLFLDADDLLGPGVLLKQMTFLQQQPTCKLTVCRNKLFSQTDDDRVPSFTGQWNLYRKSLDVHLCYFNVAPPHAYMIRRDAVLKTGYFDTGLKACEDYDFWLRAAFLGHKPFYNDDGFVYYRKHEHSMSANTANQTLHDALLHYRLADMLSRNPRYPVGRRLEAILAFTAGALKTAIRLHSNKLNGWMPMLDLVKGFLSRERLVTMKGGSKWNALLSLFYLRIASSLKHAAFRNCSATTTVRQMVRQLTSHATGCGFKMAILRNPLPLLTQKGSNEVLEKREARNLLIRYVTHRGLCDL